MGQTKAIPEGFRTVTPHMVVSDGEKAIDFYKRAFGAEELGCMRGPGGKGIMHAELKIGDSMLMLCEEFPGMDHFRAPSSLKGTSVTLHIYVEDVDKAFEKAVAAGATVSMPVTDMFWGDRYGKLTDPLGHQWSIATHTEDVTAEECAKRAQEFLSKGPGCGQ